MPHWSRFVEILVECTIILARFMALSAVSYPTVVMMLHIRNLVCPSRVSFLAKVLNQLSIEGARVSFQGINFSKVPKAGQMRRLLKQLASMGCEVCDDDGPALAA